MSFFVLAYNQAAHVRAAVEGAFAQTYAPLEIILSDDCSPDETFAIMEEMAAAYAGPHTVVLNRNPANLGLTAHIDRVMALARGDFVVQAAGDDVSLPQRTAALVAAWQADGAVTAVHSGMDRIDADGRVAPYPPRLPVCADLTPAAIVEDGFHLIGASMGWARAIFTTFGPLPAAALVEDRPIAFRAALTGRIAYVPETLLQYRMGGASDPAGTGASDPDASGGLYGYALKARRWHRSFLESYLADLEILAPPDAEALRTRARARLARLDFEIGLAEASHAARAQSLGRAAALALRARDPAPVALTLKYLFDGPYLRWRRFRKGARVSRVARVQ